MMNTLAQRVDELLQPVEAIVRGQKPSQYPASLFEQIKRMWDDQLIIESPASYVLKPSEHGQTLDMRDKRGVSMEGIKGVTTVHPISHELVLRQEGVEAATSADGIKNFKILGMDPFYRRLSTQTDMFESHDPLEQCEDAAALILTRSDFHGLRQALHVIKGKIDGDKRALETKLIIQNTNNQFWKPVLAHLGLDAMPAEQLQKLGIAVSVYRGIHENADVASTLHALREMGTVAKAEPARAMREADTIQPGDEILVASGQSHKPVEIGSVFEVMKADISVAPLSSRIIIKPREADEESRSFEGNNLEKKNSVQFRLSQLVEDLGMEKAIESLCSKGRKPENTWLLFDDRGLYFQDRRIMQTDAFASVRCYLNPYQDKPQPGAELAFVLKAASKYEFFHDMLGAAKKEIAANPEKYGPEPVNTLAVDTACYVLARLDWVLDPKNTRVVASFAKTKSIAMCQPKPGHRVEQSDFFQAPLAFNAENTPDDKLRSKGQIDGYIASHSEMALALRTLGKLTGADEHKNKPANCVTDFSNAMHHRMGALPSVEQFRLSSQYTLYPSQPSLATQYDPKKLKRLFGAAYKLISGRGRYFDLAPHSQSASEKQNTGFERAGEKHRLQVDAALDKMRLLYREADGFLLMPDSPQLKAQPGYKWVKNLFLFSLLVGKQVGDMAISNKMIALCEWNGDTSWKEQLKIFFHQNKTPILSDRLDLIVTRAADEKALAEGLKAHKRRYVRPAITEKDIVHKDDNVAIPEDLFRVTVYCSATLSSSTQASKDARELTFKLAGTGFSVINGGGSQDATMRETSEGVHEFRAWWKKQFGSAPMPRNHIASYQCHDTYEREGGWHPSNEYALILQTIEQRMAYLQMTDAEVLLAGGAGSVQEISASLLMREWGLVPTRHRPLVIVNQEVGNHRVHDALIAQLSTAERERMNVHVVNTTDEAFDIIKKARHSMRLEPGMESLYVPSRESLPAKKMAVDATGQANKADLVQRMPIG